MTRERLIRWAMGAACAVTLAAPLGAHAQMYSQTMAAMPGEPVPLVGPDRPMPQPMVHPPLPSYPQEMPPPERVFSYEGAPVVSPGDAPGNWNARQNVRESNQYEALVRSNPGFRARRMQQECGSIADPQGRDQCLSTFDYGAER